MPKKVIGIHPVCRNRLDVEDLENGYFRSGHWKIPESHARTAQYIALHESKNQPSYKQGIIETWERSKERHDRIIFYLCKSNGRAKRMDGRWSWRKGLFLV